MTETATEVAQNTSAYRHPAAAAPTTAAQPSRPGRARWVALAVLVLAVLVVALDATVLVLALPSISETLRPSATQLLWIGDAYSFVLAGLLVSVGALSDRAGHRRVLLWGTAAFGLASLGAAYAPNAGALIAARALLGVGGAAILPATLSLIRALFPDDRERARAIGVWGAAATAGAAAGPLVGGALLDRFWWGSVFLLNVVPAVLVLAVGRRLLPESRNPVAARWDVPSAGLSLLGLLGPVYAVKEAAAGNAGRPLTVVAAVLGAAALLIFVRRQLRLPVPLLDVRLFRDRRFTAAAVGTLIALVGLGGALFFLSQYFQLVRGWSPLRAGLADLPGFAGSAAGGLAAAALARRIGGRAALAGALTAMGLGLGTLGLVQAHSAYPLIAVCFLVVGAVEGCVYALATTMVLEAAPRQKAGAAAAVSETAYELGTALGIALLGSVLTALYRHGLTLPTTLRARLSPAEAATARDSLGGAVQTARHLPRHAADALLAHARTAFVHGMNLTAALAAAVLLGAAALVAWLLRERKDGREVSARRG